MLKVKTALKVCSSIMRSKAAKNVSGGFNTPEGHLSYSQIATELDKLCEFIYPKLDTHPLQKVVYCKYCDNYRKFRKNDPKCVQKPIFLCKLDHKPKDSDFWCKNGIERNK